MNIQFTPTERVGSHYYFSEPHGVGNVPEYSPVGADYVTCSDVES